MAKMQGKVRKIGVYSPKSGQQVIFNNHIWIVNHTELDDENKLWVRLSRLPGIDVCTPAVELFQLGIEYIPYKKERHIPERSQLIYLKYSQWQAAIDNGEVDSDKTVTFELIQNLFGGNEIFAVQSDIDRGKKVYAKIIPSKKEKKDNFLEKFNLLMRDISKENEGPYEGIINYALIRVKTFVHQHYKK